MMYSVLQNNMQGGWRGCAAGEKGGGHGRKITLGVKAGHEGEGVIGEEALVVQRVSHQLCGGHHAHGLPESARDNAFEGSLVLIPHRQTANFTASELRILRHGHFRRLGQDAGVSRNQYQAWREVLPYCSLVFLAIHTHPLSPRNQEEERCL